MEELFANIVELIPYAIVLLLAIGTAIASIVAFLKSLKKLKDATTNEEKANAVNDMQNALTGIIASVEKAKQGFSDYQKSRGENASSEKLESALRQLKDYAEEKGYEFDKDYWVDKTNELVDFSKQVNYK